ncbi:MAG: MBL fold metallo-hydrolase [Reyranella sp.]|uniref:MBL fold metallo-hydrolase n=1 Tax=Reyranella sp. TaxID=1929291 RepID=UPI003D0BFC8C
MKTEVSEIADRIYRLSTFLPAVGPTGFTFNQFLIDADEPLLFHYGQRSLFPLISAAVKSVIPLEKLRWTTCSHVEADESGALNQWLAAAPRATPAHGQVGCNIWLRDMADREPSVLANDEVLDLGGKRVRWLDTPHVPHNWDAGVIYEETTGTLFSSDLFTQFGPATPTTESEIVGPAIATEKAVPYMPVTKLTEPTLRRLAGLKPTTIALMHGPSFKGDGAAALTALADHYRDRLAA